MSKKLNYFQVHRNKKPKSKNKKRFDIRSVQAAILIRLSLAQNEIIKSQVGIAPISKAFLMAENTINTAKAISNIYKTNNKYKK